MRSTAENFMKILCTRDNLKNVVTQAERFTGKNVTLPILNNILLEAKGRRCSVTATNLEIALEASFSGRVVKDGVITIPARILSSLLQTVPEENIVLEEKNSVLSIQSENYKITVNGTPSKDFPLIPKIKKGSSFSIFFSALSCALKHVLPSVSRSEIKPEISGVLFKTEGKKLKLASTDTFRLAEKTIPDKMNSEGEASPFILPLKTAEELVRLEYQDDTEIKIMYTENQATFSIGEHTITTRLIDGAFPEYGGIIPKSAETRAVIKREELIQKIRAAAVLSSKLNDITLIFEGKVLVTESQNPELGSMNSKMESEQFTGEDVVLRFNFRYLLDGLESISGDTVAISMSGEHAPALLQSPNDETFLYVLMPIRNV